MEVKQTRIATGQVWYGPTEAGNWWDPMGWRSSTQGFI